MNRLIFLLSGVAIGLLLLEPSLAGNKFETIGGGISGSSQAKLQFVRPISSGFGILFLIGAILSLTPFIHKSAESPSFSTWKQSAGVLFVLSTLCFGIALFI